MGLMRLQKYLAKCGLGSRRKCEEYIDQGRVKVDGKKMIKQGVKIDPDNQVITFNSAIVTQKPIEWIMLNKPARYLSTTKDPSGKPSFLDLLPEDKHHLFAVGRLDYLSEGLLLITNDGETANKLIHPRYEIEKKYVVTTADKINENLMKKMKQGLMIQNDVFNVKNIQLIEEDKKNNQWIYSIIIIEGKNRHIRRMLASINIRIRRLKRIRIGPIQLSNVSVGKWRYLTDEERKRIYESLPR